MATQQKPPAPLWKQFSNFANTHPMGIDKTFRLVQAICTILSASVFVSYIPNPVYVVKCAYARSQLALGRRYLRFFKFIDAFEAGYKAWQDPASSDSDAAKRLGVVGKCTFLGVYLLLEDFAILDAMGVWETQWAKDVFIESQKWWFYSYILSIMVSTIELFFPTEPSSSIVKKAGKSKDEKGEKSKPTTTKREVWPIVNSLIVDSCDIIIPGSFLGWIQASPTQVGIVMIVTTVLSSRDIWNKINA